MDWRTGIQFVIEAGYVLSNPGLWLMVLAEFVASPSLYTARPERWWFGLTVLSFASYCAAYITYTGNLDDWSRVVLTGPFWLLGGGALVWLDVRRAGLPDWVQRTRQSLTYPIILPAALAAGVGIGMIVLPQPMDDHSVWGGMKVRGSIGLMSKWTKEWRRQTQAQVATFTGPKLGERLKEIYSELPIQDRERWGLRLSEMDKGASYRHELGPYRILADSGVKGHLARMVSYDLVEGEPCLVRVYDMDVWQPSENISLFDRLMTGFGIERFDDRDRLFQLEAGESEELFGILSLALYFIWSIDVYCEKPSICLRFSHDEFVEAYTNETESTESIHRMFGALLPDLHKKSA
jgi:hypothetical protein